MQVSGVTAWINVTYDYINECNKCIDKVSLGKCYPLIKKGKTASSVEDLVMIFKRRPEFNDSYRTLMIAFPCFFWISV